MAANKTVPTSISPGAFLKAVSDPRQRKDSRSLMKKLGKHKTGKSCLYIKTLEDIDLDVLRQLIKQSVSDMQQMYPIS